MDIVYQEVEITHHGRKVVGTLIEPCGISKYPLVLFSHGYNGTGEGARAISEYFAQNGIGACYYDFCGGSTRSKSDMETVQMTLSSEKEDLLALFHYFQVQEKVLADKIFFFGESQGGMVSCLAAAMTKEVAGLLLLFPALCIADDWNQKFLEISDIPEEYEFWGMKLGKDFFLELRELKVWDILPNIKQKTLIMHGEEDPSVPLAYSVRAKQLLEQAELITYPKEGHGFGPEAYRDMMEKSYQFVKKML